MKQTVLVVLVVLLIIAAQPVNPTVDPTEYTACSAGVLTPVEQEVVQDIIQAAEDGKTEVWNRGADIHRVLTHLGMYYGTMENVSTLLSGTEDRFYLNPEAFTRFERNRISVESAVEEALRHIREGSPRYKLRQIARFLADRIAYTPGVRETVDGLRGEGVCATYAMLFYKMASRLGIECYICYGYAGGGYHAWNMVILDGESYYYDVTWCDDVILNPVYIHSRNSWGREYMLNNLWACYEIKEKKEYIDSEGCVVNVYDIRKPLSYERGLFNGFQCL